MAGIVGCTVGRGEKGKVVGEGPGVVAESSSRSAPESSSKSLELGTSTIC